MPTDAELRSLFQDASAPPSSIDAASIIRRSKRRRLPQQLGAGSVLTLAVAGIGVAGFTGLRGLTPMVASESVADAPMGVAESGPFAGTDGAASERDASCAADAVADASATAGLELGIRFPEAAPSGQSVTGALTLTNTGAEAVTGIVQSVAVTLTGGGEVAHHRDPLSAEKKVALAPGDSVTFAFTFDAVECDAQGGATGGPLEPGEYTLSAVLELLSGDGSVRVVGGPASVITLR